MIGLRLKTCAALFGAYVVGLVVFRNRLLHIGSTAYESKRAMPGDEIVPDAIESTRAISIKAQPDDIWPWLVQMGQDRAGFYSFDLLERLAGAGIHNADRIVTNWQQLEPGDLMRTYRYIPRFEPLGWFVEEVVPARSVVVRSRGFDWSWSLLLEPLDDRTTRLVARTRAKRIPLPGSILNIALTEPAHLVMEIGFLRGVRKRVEKRVSQRAIGQHRHPTDVQAA